MVMYRVAFTSIEQSALHQKQEASRGDRRRKEFTFCFYLSGSRKHMPKARHFLKWLLGIFFALTGANHFIHTGFYVSIMPPYLPWHAALVYISGVAEMVLGVMLLFRRTEVIAAWGTIALIIAVTPANIHMAIHAELYPAYSAAALWARLPLQGVLIAWAFWFTRPLTD